MNKFFFLLLVSLAVSSSFVRCTEHTEEDDKEEEKEHIKYVVTHEVFFDVAIKDSKEGPAQKEGRIVIGLFGDVCPMTVTNFVHIAKGFKRENVSQSFITIKLFT
jgi:hypothetical protein